MTCAALMMGGREPRVVAYETHRIDRDAFCERLARSTGSLHTPREVAYAALGEHGMALETAEQALSRMEALGEKEGAAIALNNLGNAHMRLGDLTGAVASYEGASFLAQEAASREWIVKTLLGLGQVQREFGPYAQALDTYASFQRLRRGWGDKEGAEDTFREVCDVWGLP